MRFAYIDSQGNEVPIPSIDALALRIELGAVGPETQLYDAQADHWGPAHTHEIFHSLSRDAEGERFMAPPPPAASTRPPAEDAPQAPEAVDEPEPEPERKARRAPKPKAKEAKPGDEEFDLGLTLAAPPPEPEESEETIDGRAADMALDLETPSNTPLIAESEPLVPDEPAPAPEGPAAANDGGGFDFGDLGSGLELEGSLADDEMELETEAEFQSPAGGFDGGGEELQLEQPMSAFEPDSPPGWMGESEPDEVMDFSAVAAEEEATEEVAPVPVAPARQRRNPKDRPSKPRFKRQRALGGPIVFVVFLLAIGVGGYVGWPILQVRLAERNAPERPAVVMPAIPEELLPQMRSLGEAAIAGVVTNVNEATRASDAPEAPDDDWLAGVYLGNASQYGSIEGFWSSLQSFTRGLRAAEWQAYHDEFVEAVAGSGLEAAAAAQVTERADSGFVAAQPRRSAAYAELERLVDAALDLHDFLLTNEADIVFRPGMTSASDPTVDPVLEIAAPDDDRARMLDMFDEITDALDALGTLDRVTRERLVAAMTARLQQVGIE